MATYKQYNMLLDPDDQEEKELIAFLSNKHGKKNKDSYSAILKTALKLYKAVQDGSLKVIGNGEKND